MGCTNDRQKIEDKMGLIKLERMEIQAMKEKEYKKLSELEGRPVQRKFIPDYIDPEFAKEKHITTDYAIDLNNLDEIKNKKKDKIVKKEKKGKDQKRKKKTVEKMDKKRKNKK